MVDKTGFTHVCLMNIYVESFVPMLQIVLGGFWLNNLT